MTYQPHFLLAWGGIVNGTPEIWNNTLRLASPDGMTWGESISNMSGALEDLAADVVALITNPGANYSGTHLLTYVKFNEIGPDGRYVSSTTNEKIYEGTARPAGGGGTSQFPLQTACAVSFTTAKGRGPASRGRLFVPRPAMNIDTAGRWSVADCSDTANAFVMFINAVNNWPGFDAANSPVASVVSKVGAPGPVEPITHVSVGNVPDTQRRRRNALDEAYTVRPLV